MTQSGLHSLKIEVFNGLSAQEVLNLFGHASVHRLGERRFF
jgi:hypothetical protein